MTAPRQAAWLWALLALHALLWAGALPARAHSFEPAVLTLRERAPGTYDIKQELPRSLPATLTVDYPAPCTPDAAAERLRCGPAGLTGRPLRIRAQAPVPIDVLVVLFPQGGRPLSGIVGGGSGELVLLAAETPETTPGAPAPSPGALAAARQYLRLGVTHILHGTDHLLLVLGLLLLVGTPRGVVRTVTAFTLAHSLTLALAALGVLSPPAALVEVLIALSLVCLARELVAARPDSLGRRFPESLALLFGLLHGLGFAGALAEVGLPRTQLTLALFSFNVGVELGQLAFVLLCALVLRGIRRLGAGPFFLGRMPAYAIGAVAAAWSLERGVRLFQAAP